MTGQPDWYTVVCSYQPKRLCLESKTIKLFLQSYRDKGLFCEKFASEILEAVVKAISPRWAWVEVIQTPRGGVGLKATANWAE